MASFDPIDQFDALEPPPRPTTPTVRRGFLMVLGVLCILALLVYGVPTLAERTGYAWETGRARAAGEALARLDKAGILNEASALFRLASTKVMPAVVNIQNIKSGRGGGPLRESVESGSGFVIDAARGYIVTNHHVVEGAGELIVRFGAGQQVPGRFVAADPKTDIAVIQVEGPLKVAAEWGDSDRLDVGDWVLAIGSPLTLDRTVTAGIVSATGRRRLGLIGEGAYEDFAQTDAALNPGNSGGPLIDLNGRVVGVNTLIVSMSGGNQGIGMAISAKLAKKVVGDLIKQGRVARGYLGVALEDLAPADARRMRLDGGAVIRRIEPESPAAEAGLRPGDVVTQVAGRAVADPTALRLNIAELPSGTAVPLEIVRDGRPQTVTVTIGEFPSLLSLGLQLRRATEEELSELPGRPDRAVLVGGVEPGSAAFRTRLLLQRGLRILAVGDTPVTTPAEANAAAARFDPSQGIPLHVQLPDGRTGQITLGGPTVGRRR
jgi:S1-C subfamily serine protease